jgi:CO/xanthine dehydrogenase Mo-binding subunit
VTAIGTAYATNTAPNGAFRGFGVPQTMFAIEAQMDKIAEALNMSPLDLRRKNCFREGDEMATGQILKDSAGALECLEKAAAASDFERKWKECKKLNDVIASAAKQSPDVHGIASAPSGPRNDYRLKKGIGISLFHHGAGFTGSGEAKLKGKAGVRLEKDGKLTVLTACTDMGQGAHTVLPQIVADTMGVPLSYVNVETPNTARVPDSGPTVASRTTTVIGHVLATCAEELKKELFEFAEEQYGVDRKKLRIVDGVIYNGESKHGDLKSLAKAILKKRGPITIIEAYAPPSWIHWDDITYRGDAYAAYSWACDVAEVEVDAATLEVKVKKMWLVQDIGRAINPQLTEGQIEGGTLQAVGYALMEDQRYDRGRLLNNRLQTYIIPTTLDSPEFETIIVEKPFSYGPMGAKGVGELPMDGGAPAIINAIANATGLRISELPATPEKLFEEWKKHSPPL